MAADDPDHTKSDTELELIETNRLVAELFRRNKGVLVLIEKSPDATENVDEFAYWFCGGISRAVGMAYRFCGKAAAGLLEFPELPK